MRKLKIDPKVILALIEKHHGNVAAISRALGVNWSTADRTIRSRKDLTRAFEVATEVRLDLAEEQLDRLVEAGNLRACIYILSTLGRGRGYVTKQELDANYNQVYQIDWHDGQPGPTTDSPSDAIPPSGTKGDT